jgi:heme ABC exporter ATP-binding subunit CcmA
VSGPALRAVGLGKRFGRSLALDGVDLELAAGASLAVLGPNGAGKSTLLRLMAGLARPTSGSLTIFGVPAHRPAARAQVGFIGHASLLYPSLTARENLLFAARLQRVGEAPLRVERLLESAGLARVADLPVAGFSRGMSQRLSIARGLVHEPPLLLLDEPFAGLDPRAAAALAARLSGLRRDGRTLVLVTHDPRLAHELADRALVLGGGRVVFERKGSAGGAEALERALLAASDAAA